jgi:copper chaperone NosL
VTGIVSRLAGAALLLLAACSPDETASAPKPLEPDANSIAYFCHMSLPEHEGPKGQIFLRGREQPIWLASIHEVFTYLEIELAQPHDLLAVYVNDMAQGTWEQPAAGAWIEAEKALYVIGSSKTSAMGEQEAVPFSSREAAAAFVAQFGGEIADYDAARKALAVEPAPDGG